MDVSRILEDLNPAQRDAVSSDKKSVSACAGSGKTRVLVIELLVNTS